MLTERKLEIYIKYSGDIDAFTIGGTKKEKSIMNDSDWILIDDLIQDIELIEKNLISEEMKIRVKEKMKINLVDENIERILKQIIKEGI